jgi:hypothetical protein
VINMHCAVDGAGNDQLSPALASADLRTAVSAASEMLKAGLLRRSIPVRAGVTRFILKTPREYLSKGGRFYRSSRPGQLPPLGGEEVER